MYSSIYIYIIYTYSYAHIGLKVWAQGSGGSNWLDPGHFASTPSTPLSQRRVARQFSRDGLATLAAALHAGTGFGKAASEKAASAVCAPGPSRSKDLLPGPQLLGPKTDGNRHAVLHHLQDYGMEQDTKPPSSKGSLESFLCLLGTSWTRGCNRSSQRLASCHLHLLQIQI